MEVIVHEGCEGVSEFESFVGRFNHLQSLITKPSDEFDPLKHLKYVDGIEIWTPKT